MFLDFWCYQTMRSRIQPMKKSPVRCALTVPPGPPTGLRAKPHGRLRLLLNYFKARKQFSSGMIEGLNNEAKVTMKRSYGFPIFRILELALYRALSLT
jgi:transposase